MDLNQYSKHAALAARVIQYVMTVRLGLTPPAEYTLTDHNGLVWLVASMDTLTLGRLEAYENPNVAHQLSTVLSETFQARPPIPVILANHTGLRYCMLFGKRPSLPRRIDFPGFGARNIFRFGMGLRGEIALPARMLKNFIIGAAQEKGKSNILRLVTHQARSFGWDLYLADSQAHTFNPDVWNGLARQPVAQSTDSLLDLLGKLSGALEDRSAMFRAAARGGIPPADIDAYNSLDNPLPRILLAIDEASTPLQDKRVFKLLAELLREGRKWGLHIGLSGHEWHKEVIPAEVNDMLQTRIALPMIDEGSGYVVTRSHSWGRWVIGKPVGRGVLRTNQYTPMQFFLVMPEQEQEWLSAVSTPAPLSENEMEIVHRSIAEADGKMTISLLKEWGLEEWDARTMLERYEGRGWLVKDGAQKNARCMTKKLVDLVSNAQTAQTATNTQICPQTDLKPSQTLNMGLAAL